MSSLATVLLCAALGAAPIEQAEAALAAGKHVAPLVAADGARLALYRYVPEAGPNPRRSVLLLPDVGMTHRSYDDGGFGLAPALARRDVEVFVLEPRGAGRSQVPPGGYRLEDLLGDAEAALRQATAGRPRIAVGGCGLGGTLALLLAARNPERVSGFVGLQAAVRLEMPNEPIAALAAEGRWPAWALLPRVASQPLFGERSWFEVMLANDGAFAREELPALSRRVLAPVPGTLLAQLAAQAREGHLALHGVDVRQSFGGWRGPSLLFFAPRDNWIHPEHATPLRDLLGRSTQEVRVLGTLEGARRDYGHLGMLLATSAERDVFVPVARFLQGLPTEAP